MLEFQDRVMSRVTSEPVSAFFEYLHEQNGVRFVFGAAVTAVEGTERAERVLTADGTAYPADVVLAGIGVVPEPGAGGQRRAPVPGRDPGGRERTDLRSGDLRHR